MRKIEGRKCKHNWQYHITSYRCGIDDYYRICTKCLKNESIRTVDLEQEAATQERIAYCEWLGR